MLIDSFQPRLADLRMKHRWWTSWVDDKPENHSGHVLESLSPVPPLHLKWARRGLVVRVLPRTTDAANLRCCILIYHICWIYNVCIYSSWTTRHLFRTFVHQHYFNSLATSNRSCAWFGSSLITRHVSLTSEIIQRWRIQYNTIQYNIVSICISPQMAVDSPFLYELFSVIHEVSGDVSWDAARDPNKPHTTRLGNYCKLTLKMLGVAKTSNIASTYKRFMQGHNIWKQKRNSVQKTFGFSIVKLEWFTHLSKPRNTVCISIWPLASFWKVTSTVSV